MSEYTINVLGFPMPIDMFNDLADIIGPTLRGYKFGCIPHDFECGICYMGGDRPCVYLECDHVFHLDCIETWIIQKIGFQ